jgi:hypothetical protein
MKELRKVCLCLFIFALVLSCSNDDEGSTNTTNLQVIGLWDLTEVNVNSSQDIDMDGSLSSNLMDELECISGTLLIDGDMVWTFEQTNVSITTITNGHFFAQCSGTVAGTGAWTSSETEVVLQGSDLLGTLSISGDRLIKNVGEDLPGIRSYVYVRRAE